MAKRRRNLFLFDTPAEKLVVGKVGTRRSVAEKWYKSSSTPNNPLALGSKVTWTVALRPGRTRHAMRDLRTNPKILDFGVIK